MRKGKDTDTEAKDSAANVAAGSRNELYRIIRAICPTREAAVEFYECIEKSTLDRQMVKLLVLCQPQLVPRASWIEMCLRTGTDPGTLVSRIPQQCLAEILKVTENPVWKPLPSFQRAAFTAAAELAFVAPEEMTPLLVAQIERDLDPMQLESIGPTEAAIYRTPEGTAFVDVLSKQAPTAQISKSAKDYEKKHRTRISTQICSH